MSFCPAPLEERVLRVFSLAWQSRARRDLLSVDVLSLTVSVMTIL